MKTINTTAGPIDADRLGATYMHEHVFIVSPEMQSYWPGYGDWREDEEVERARAALTRLREEYGCQTIVDPTVPGIGRNIRAVARAAEGSGVNVIVATGWYIYDQLPFTFQMQSSEEKIETLRRLFVTDAEQGMEGTGIRPGVIKCATDAAGLTVDVEAVLRAAARAHVQTGLPITTHTHAASRSGLEQQRIFREEGVDPGAVVIGHCNESDSLEYLEQLIENGTYIGFDRCGLEMNRPDIPPAQVQTETLSELIARGHADRIVLSHDNSCFTDLYPRERLEGKTRGAPYSFLHRVVLPALRERGVGERDIERMLVENPRRYFSGAGTRAQAPEGARAAQRIGGAA